MTTGAHHWGQETGSGLASPRRGGGSRMEPPELSAPAQGRVAPIRKDGAGRGLRLSSQLRPNGPKACWRFQQTCAAACPCRTLVIRQPRRTRPRYTGAAAFPINPNHDAAPPGVVCAAYRGARRPWLRGGRPVALPPWACRQSIRRWLLQGPFGLVRTPGGNRRPCVLPGPPRTRTCCGERRPERVRVTDRCVGEGRDAFSENGRRRDCRERPAQLFHQPVNDIRDGLKARVSAHRRPSQFATLRASPPRSSRCVSRVPSKAPAVFVLNTNIRSRVKSFWYGKARGPTPEELETARQVAVKHARDLELLRNEHRRALDILARLETRLATIDPDFFEPDTAALRGMVSPTPRAGNARGLTLDAPEKGSGQ